MEDFSSLNKLLHVTAYCFQFIALLQKKTATKGIVSAEEMQNACEQWELCVQHSSFPAVINDIRNKNRNQFVDELGLFLDKNEFIRCQGQLLNASIAEEAKYPKLLPKNSTFTALVVQNCHRKLFHSGCAHTLAQVRQKYWIPQGRSCVSSVLKKCLVCRRWNGPPFQIPPCPPLPVERLTEGPPFSYTGVDYLGPLFVRNEEAKESHKVWVCLFTCAVIRAIHLEVVHNLSSEQFLLCLRRFISRFGKPQKVISDNAKTFKLSSSVLDKLWRQTITSTEVQEYSASEGIQWQFIIEFAPWMGGFYERLVGTVKSALKKSLGKGCLTFVQLQTVVSEIQAVVNTRPLLYVDAELDNNHTGLTPAHFLSQNRNFGLPNIETDPDPEFKLKSDSIGSLLQSWKKSQHYLNQFWSSWKNEYLLNLQERSVMKNQHSVSPCQPSPGQVVLIKDSLPRGQWKMGQIQSLNTGKDGHKRSAKIKLTSGSIVQRSVKLLFPLEYSESLPSELPVLMPPPSTTPPASSRPVRQAAVKARNLIKLQTNE